VLTITTIDPNLCIARLRTHRQISLAWGLATLLLLATPLCRWCDADDSNSKAPEVTATSTDDGVRIEIDGKPFAEYLTNSAPQPVIWPVVGPTGKNVTRSFPLGPVQKSEKEDHVHHRSLWFTHGDVNGLDFWRDQPTGVTDQPQNLIAHRDFTNVKSGNPAVVSTRNDWTSDGEKICEDDRTVLFGVDPNGTRWIDYTLTFKATESDIVLGDTKEGMFAVRVAGTMKVDTRKGGRILNPDGKTDKDAWGEPANWIEYSGPVDGETIGISILSHPQNFRHPCRWHVRTYGLFAANPIGEHHFKPSTVEQGAITIRKGESLILRYRVVIHQGAWESEQVESAYQQFIADPATKTSSES